MPTSTNPKDSTVITEANTTVYVRHIGALYNTAYILTIGLSGKQSDVDVELADGQQLVFEAVRAPHEGEDRAASLVNTILAVKAGGGGIIIWNGKMFQPQTADQPAPVV